jgi:hypothetical protein
MWRVGMGVSGARSYTVTRSVNDLWLWWALIHGVSYLVTSVPRTLFGSSGIVTIITGIIALVMELWVLGRYLNDFNWQQWIVVSIVGALLGLIVSIVPFIFAQMVVGQSAPVSSLRALLTNILVGAITALIVALAQWRVLTRYVRGYGIGPWVAANVISVIIVSLSGSIMKEITHNGPLDIAGNTFAALIGYIIIGYTLMQILRPYAPTAAPA